MRFTAKEAPGSLVRSRPPSPIRSGVVKSLEATLSERVDEAIRSHKSSLQSTTGPVSAIGELVNRIEGLEAAIREVALEVQNLAASTRR
jgi:predicted sugar kinase